MEFISKYFKNVRARPKLIVFIIYYNSIQSNFYIILNALKNEINTW